jgi:hypothetical protein
MPTFATPEPISVAIELVVGEARIVASDRTDTVVEVRPSDPGRELDVKAAAQTRVDYADGTLSVTANRPRTFFGRSGSVDVTIELPTGSRVSGHAAAADFRCEGRLGECRLKTQSGQLRLDQTGALHLHSSSGKIIVDHATGDVDVTVHSGEVLIREIDGTAVIKNSNGDTNVGTVTGDARLNAANGRISVDHAYGSVVAKTANGDVRIGDVVRGSIVLEAASGDLEVGIRPGTAAWLDVRSLSGNVRNLLDAAEGPGQTDATVEVRARNLSGGITIRRSRLDAPE